MKKAILGVSLLLLSLLFNKTFAQRSEGGYDQGNHPMVEQEVKNFPNPFNGATTIKYSVPIAGIVTIKIFNSSGQFITTVVNEEQSAGVHHVNLNHQGLASGLYICVLTVDIGDSKKTVVRRMNLIN